METITNGMPDLEIARSPQPSKKVKGEVLHCLDNVIIPLKLYRKSVNFTETIN